MFDAPPKIGSPQVGRLQGLKDYMQCHICKDPLMDYGGDGTIIYEFSEIEIFQKEAWFQNQPGIDFTQRQSVHVHDLCMEKHVGFTINENIRNLNCVSCSRDVGKLGVGKRFYGIGKEAVTDIMSEMVELLMFRYMCGECFHENAGANFFQEKNFHIK